MYGTQVLPGVLACLDYVSKEYIMGLQEYATKQWVECVPNFSEGRRADVVDAIVAAIASEPAIYILDTNIDRDHNRTVVTFVGTPHAVSNAAFQGIRVAARLIDMDMHSGVHPRVGATDVVPFIPLQNVTMDDCIELAHQLGRKVAGELNVPVYLYEAAATQPSRKNLADVRRGEYERLKLEIATNPDRKPDYGATVIGKAGATVIGARQTLIAYNVYLTTDDVTIAQQIAKRIRQSGGGLPYVKAIGVLVDGQAQVSMNLTDYTQSPIHVVMDAIHDEAQTFGVSIDRSELIGLMPEQVLIQTAKHYLQLDQLSLDHVLEYLVRNIG